MTPLDRATGLWNGIPWQEARPRKERAEDCPHCRRPISVYPRKLSSSMARNLVRLHWLHRKNPSRTQFHVKEFDMEGARGEFGVIQLWGLVQQAGSGGNEKRTSGCWKLSESGRAFVLGETRVPEYVLVGLRSALQGYAGPMVDIRHALEHKNRFRYDELMGEDFGKGVQLALDMRMGPKSQ